MGDKKVVLGAGLKCRCGGEVGVRGEGVEGSGLRREKRGALLSGERSAGGAEGQTSSQCAR